MVVLYKNNCAVTGDKDGDKFFVKWCVSSPSSGKKAVFASQKVRPKDVILLSENDKVSLEECLSFEQKVRDDEQVFFQQIQEAYELILSDDENVSPVSLNELIELFYGSVNAGMVWGLLCAVRDSLYFEEIIDESSPSGFGKIFFLPRTSEKINELKNKNFEKEHQLQLRQEFILRLKQGKLLLPDDAKFMVEVESYALGKSEHCKALKEAGIKESLEKAHEILLKTGIWDITRNPYPVRWGLSTKSAEENLMPPPEEKRVEISQTAYAIDSPWSSDPDDAISFDGEYLWVHIADPSCSVKIDSIIDKSARERGATLYLPEGAVRMLSENCLEDYALGLKEKSIAMSFKIKLDDDYEIESCDIFPSVVNVKRITYEEADKMKESPELKSLFFLAQKRRERRKSKGAVSIKMPEIKISVDKDTKEVSFFPVTYFESADVVQEAMILAGEGAAKFAFKNNIPFPYISQEIPDIPKDIPEGLAGQFKLRKCMRKRNVGVTPAPHGAMGLSFYSQVTSPLRRYGDLVSHQQLRLFLNGEKLIEKDDLLFRISQGDAAMRSAKQAERNSAIHWTLVYLIKNPDWSGSAICLSNDCRQPVFLVEEFGLETVILGASSMLNERINVKVEKINLPLLQVVFRQI